MRTTEISPLLGLLALLGLSSCQSVDHNGATRVEKTAALSAHLADWKPKVLVNQFAQPRTAQIFNNLVVDRANKRLDASSTGQATFLTPDGYALTAAHVLDDGPLSILKLEEARPGKLVLTPAGPVLFRPQHSDRPTRVSIGALESHPVRLVRRFRGTDLALIKLPVRPTHTFKLAGSPPANGTTLFSYGSNLSGNSSAGKSLKTQNAPLISRSRIWSLTTSIPLQKGDSGGPVMDADGTLVGIISRGRTELFANKITSTVALGIQPNYLRKIIDLDRTGQ